MGWCLMRALWGGLVSQGSPLGWAGVSRETLGGLVFLESSLGWDRVSRETFGVGSCLRGAFWGGLVSQERREDPSMTV